MSQAQSYTQVYIDEWEDENEKGMELSAPLRSEQALSTHGIRVDLLRSGLTSISSAIEDNEVVRTDPPCSAYLVFSLVYLQFSLVGDRK